MGTGYKLHSESNRKPGSEVVAMLKTFCQEKNPPEKRKLHVIYKTEMSVMHSTSKSTFVMTCSRGRNILFSEMMPRRSLNYLAGKMSLVKKVRTT